MFRASRYLILLSVFFSSHLVAVPADLDDDGIPNQVESNLGLNPSDSSDGSMDLDGDGWSNLNEYRFGSALNNAEDTPLNQPARHQKVFAGDGAENDHFGYAVDIDEDTAVIGAPSYIRGDERRYNFGSGAAYVFVRIDNTWHQQAKLLASDRGQDPVSRRGNRFGASVSVAGDTIVVGAPAGDNPNGREAGSAYVFVRNGSSWSQQAKLVANYVWTEAGFGNSVSLSGDTLLVGAWYPDWTNEDAHNRAFVFVRNGTSWSLQATLGSGQSIWVDVGFGHSVSLSGDTALVGAFRDSKSGVFAGSTYVFTRNGSSWSQQAKLWADDGAQTDFFGFSVSLSENIAVIGAPLDDDRGSNSGSAYVFVRNGTDWSQETKILASDGAPDNQFGYNLKVSESVAVIGAPQNASSGANSGSAYVFTRNLDSWIEQEKLVANDGAAHDWLAYKLGVSLSGDTVVAGSYWDDDNGFNSGDAYLFNIDHADGNGGLEDIDTDGDGLSDLLEIALGTDPLLADTDNDGLTDFDELNRDGDASNYTPQVDLDPLNPDTDGDGINDGYDQDPLVFSLPLNSDEDIPFLPIWAYPLLVLGLARLGLKHPGRSKT